MSQQLDQHVSIIPLAPLHQPDIDRLMLDIANEFVESIATAETKKIIELSLLPTDKYWVAQVNGKVIGTIGFTMIANSTIVLKRVFLANDHRGKGIANALLTTVLDWVAHHQIRYIYLGTMTQYKAAQKFYENNGFTRISEADLPADFPKFLLDSVFYRLVVG
ncbi:GNAT family N-acetyltransferase [Spirosoma spitsbergense]|uniref:GNAT family N-acetyltransferase n=1 Tax=Spirosoma spitsbergense TaxID=431554 RepID=UPI00036B2F06|nr:GNAT family N-acetyltransferase [Spirosoma spitsbergense]